MQLNSGLLFTGEGQHGDQLLTDGNKALLQHAESGRRVRVFEGVRGSVTYVGEFDVDAEEPYFWAEAPDRDTLLRRVVVFRLRPVEMAVGDTTSPAEVQGPSTGAAHMVRVPIEKQNVETYPVIVNAVNREGSRREQSLVLSYERWLNQQGCTAFRWQFRPPDEAHYLYCDLFNETRNQIVEAKASGTRGEIRMAVGQLADYRRYLPPGTALGVLLEARPRPDLEDLLHSQQIAAIWRSGVGFADNADGDFV